MLSEDNKPSVCSKRSYYRLDINALSNVELIWQEAVFDETVVLGKSVFDVMEWYDSSCTKCIYVFDAVDGNDEVDALLGGSIVNVR